MIDSIILTFGSTMYRIIEPDKFIPSARWIENPVLITSGIRSKQNVTQKELRNGIYKPYLTLSNCVTHNRIRDIMLKVELSLPKLLFGNNFQELQHKDFALIIQKLTATLESMGVKISEDALAHAKPVRRSSKSEDGLQLFIMPKTLSLKMVQHPTITSKKSKNPISP